MDKLLSMIPIGLFGWYPFQPKAKTLYVGHKEDVYARWLQEQGFDYRVCQIDDVVSPRVDEQSVFCEKFDVILCVAEFEKLREPHIFFEQLKQLQKTEGILLLGANNRLGLRYFCGDRDPYTDRVFDGIENYQRAYAKSEDEFWGRTYGKSELKKMLSKAGYEKIKFYSVLSDLHNPSMIYAEDYLPNEDLSNRLFPTYHYPSTVFLEERNLYEGIINNEMFHQMANAYLIECTIDGSLSDVKHITASLERGREDALYTVIHDNGKVEKRAAFEEGRKRMEQIHRNLNCLRSRGLSVVDGQVIDDTYVMPYESAEIGQVYLKGLLYTDIHIFLQEMDHFRDLILHSSEIIKEDFGDGEGAILRYGYLDMVPLNSFHKDNTFVFFDQEFCEENYPANVLLFRMVATFYSGDIQAYHIYPMTALLERYDLNRQLDKWRKIEGLFLQKLRSEKELENYHKMVRADDNEVYSNRQRLNYSAKDYQHLFVDIFDRADTRKLFLFGSGNYTKKFLQIYGNDYKVEAILDNNTDRWGQEMDGIMIQSPDILRDLEPAEYKVIICIKNYLSVMKQLDEMGVGDYSIFDWNKDYPRKMRPIAVASDKENLPKKYHIGYVAGAFDMFHVGHLNLLRRAKELCDYLIVGVLADQTICEKKNKTPIIPEEDRVAIIASCRYVDQAELLPVHYNGIMDAYRMFHFDVQFSGNDHVGDVDWEREKADLERVGADIIYFDYTEKVSSSELRKKL